MQIKRINHSCFLIKNDKTVYTDPFSVPDGMPAADVIFVSHSHYDHCSIDEIKKIANADTIIVCPKIAGDKLGWKYTRLIVKPGQVADVAGMHVEVVFAYNINKAFHPKSREDNVGYVFVLDEKRFYFAGDSDFIPEMSNLKNIDVAFLPVSGVYVMDADDAARACEAIKPKVAIPMHYGIVVGSESDAQKFKEKAKGCEVKIL